MFLLFYCYDGQIWNRVLTSSREWRHFKAINEVHTPLEENMFNEDSLGQYAEIFMKPAEVINIPFKFQSFRAHHLARDQVNNFNQFLILIYCERKIKKAINVNWVQ